MKNQSIFKNTYFLVAMLIGAIATTIFLFYRYQKMQVDRKKTIDAINLSIETGAGVEKQNDVSSTLINTKADPHYNGEPDAKALQNAIGYVWDDDGIVFKTLTGKTKAKLKSIENALKKLYGYASFDEFLKKIFDKTDTWLPFQTLTEDNCVGIDCGKYAKALKIIKSAN